MPITDFSNISNPRKLVQIVTNKICETKSVLSNIFTKIKAFNNLSKMLEPCGINGFFMTTYLLRDKSDIKEYFPTELQNIYQKVFKLDINNTNTLEKFYYFFQSIFVLDSMLNNKGKAVLFRPSFLFKSQIFKSFCAIQRIMMLFDNKMSLVSEIQKVVKLEELEELEVDKLKITKIRQIIEELNNRELLVKEAMQNKISALFIYNVSKFTNYQIDFLSLVLYHLNLINFDFESEYMESIIKRCESNNWYSLIDRPITKDERQKLLHECVLILKSIGEDLQFFI